MYVMLEGVRRSQHPSSAGWNDGRPVFVCDGYGFKGVGSAIEQIHAYHRPWHSLDNQ